MPRYEITVEGVVGPALENALDGFQLRPSPPGRSCLLGEVADQAALGGLLHRLQDLQAPIVEVRRMEDF